MVKEDDPEFVRDVNIMREFNLRERPPKFHGVDHDGISRCYRCERSHLEKDECHYRPCCGVVECITCMNWIHKGTVAAVARHQWRRDAEDGEHEGKPEAEKLKLEREALYWLSKLEGELRTCHDCPRCGFKPDVEELEHTRMLLSQCSKGDPEAMFRRACLARGAVIKGRGQPCVQLMFRAAEKGHFAALRICGIWCLCTSTGISEEDDAELKMVTQAMELTPEKGMEFLAQAAFEKGCYKCAAIVVDYSPAHRSQAIKKLELIAEHDVRALFLLARLRVRWELIAEAQQSFEEVVSEEPGASSDETVPETAARMDRIADKRSRRPHAYYELACLEDDEEKGQEYLRLFHETLTARVVLEMDESVYLNAADPIKQNGKYFPAKLEYSVFPWNARCSPNDWRRHYTEEEEEEMVPLKNSTTVQTLLSRARQYEAGSVGYGDNAQAQGHFRQAARLGHARSYVTLARLWIAGGPESPRHLQKACEFLVALTGEVQHDEFSASVRGDLGWMKYRKILETKTPAAEMWKIAAYFGDRDSQYEYAICLEDLHKGSRPGRLHHAALALYRDCAKRGHREAGHRARILSAYLEESE